MSQPVADRLKCYCTKCVDFHAHFVHREVYEISHPHSVSSCFGERLLSLDTPQFQRLLDPELQVADMDARGIDCHVLSSSDVVMARSHWATPEEDARLTAIVNDECMRWVHLHPDRFIPSAALPIGDMKLALKEIERVRAMGVRILNLPSNYRDVYLGESPFDELWAAVLEMDLIVFIHPDGIRDRWFQAYSMWNSIGQSIEEVKVMSSLIYEGVMDRYKGVKIVMAHGGGYMPHYMGRLDRNVLDKPFTAKNISKNPSEYLSDFFYDSCVYDPRTLELLVERVGIDRVVLGGDYPVADVDPIDFLDRVRLSDPDRARIAGGNAMALLGLS
uniref:amidohydrolase family protein n=1 Tax=uncultured Sphingomonas sp. TaxID=158754 RepID=UPI0035CBEBD0